MLATENDSEVIEGIRGRRLIDARTAAGKAGCSPRNWLRLCDEGLAPWGVKLGALRRWDETQLNQWIAGGCKPVTPDQEMAHVA